MNPNIIIDDREFKAAARKLFQTSSRTLVDFINGQALKVAVESVRHTEKADAARITWQLGVIRREESSRVLSRGKNKGQTRVTLGAYVTINDSLAARILGVRFRKTGEFGVKGDTPEQRIHNLIVQRVRSRAFIASGWVWARNALWSIVKRKPQRMSSVAGVRVSGRPKGRARPATFALSSKIVAEIGNTALLQPSAYPSVSRDPTIVAGKGLQAAMNVAARDMLDELARRLNPDLKAVSAK